MQSKMTGSKNRKVRKNACPQRHSFRHVG
jgi:hypothetical protein